MKAEVNAKMIAEAQANTANATVNALLEEKQNAMTAVESETPMPLAESSLLSNTASASSAFSQRKYPTPPQVSEQHTPTAH